MDYATLVLTQEIKALHEEVVRLNAALSGAVEIQTNHAEIPREWLEQSKKASVVEVVDSLLGKVLGVKRQSNVYRQST